MYADAGDVYCVYNIRLKQYTACQVTRVEEHGGKKHVRPCWLWTGRATNRLGRRNWRI
ncbi:Uncharacterised protein [Neisseria meningitidis]|nr:hypothetical protein NMEN92045_0257 [Neisseria meningitidis 92045]EPF58381.1 hypothetical protein NM134_0274 [Neisseria meningitidis NM134]CWN26503.1 Uncharacterised protein [Neisseria meningitidis]CWN61495.1 Uncharacterised protein [Neisseria meningitidis]CWP16970.1 Uncharacterised protein [Neisseria meningitidis]